MANFPLSAAHVDHLLLLALPHEKGHSFSLKLESWNANGLHLRMSRFSVTAVCRYPGFSF